MRVGFVGLGNQGAPIAARIAAAGIDCAVWARRPEALDPFRTGPARVVGSLRELGSGVDLLASCVFDAAGTWNVLFGPSGAAPAMPRGSVIAVHSTVAPAEVRELAAQAAKYGLQLLDAPVSGGRAKAASGELLTMIGGEASVLAEFEPVFRTFSAEVVHLGPVGAGQIAKLLNNAMFTAHLGVAADAFGIATDSGLDPAAFAAVIRHGSGRSYGADAIAGGPGLAALVRSQARPTLKKDVGLLADLVGAGHSGGVLLSNAQRTVAALDELAADRSDGRG
jgi:3-hydroxyisobutyrate dehydrogenase